MADTFDALALGIAKKYDLPEDLFLHIAKQQREPAVPQPDAQPAKAAAPEAAKAVRPATAKLGLPDLSPAEPFQAPAPSGPGLVNRLLAQNAATVGAAAPPPVDLGGVKVPGKPKPVKVAQVGPLPVAKDFAGPPSKNVKGLLGLVNQYLGTPYSWGGGGPGGPSRGFGRGANTVGFDCSSFLQFLMAKQGIKIPRVTYDQWKTGRSVPRGQLRPGDAVFFRPGPRGPEHVGIWIGNGQFAQAPKTGDVVKISKLTGYYAQTYMGARRYR